MKEFRQFTALVKPEKAMDTWLFAPNSTLPVKGIRSRKLAASFRGGRVVFQDGRRLKNQAPGTFCAQSLKKG